MNLNDPQTKISKSILVKVLQWFYLVLGLTGATFFLWYKQIPYLSQLNLASEFMLALSVMAGIYCLALAFSFFTQNTNLLILSLVLIFFTTIGAGIMLAVTVPNAQTILSGKLPQCTTNLAACSIKDGIVVASALLMVVSVPTLILNLITIVGAVKAIAATD